MGVQKDEDFITEFVFVKLYNRSKAFRKIIEDKFGTHISEEIEFSGTKNKRNPDFGCPDAVGKDGKLYIEVKTRMNTPLTEFETKDGALYVKVKGEFKKAAKCSSSETKGNRKANSYDRYGYRKYLKDDKDNKLLYLVCNKDYNMSSACPEKSGRVVYMYWTEILTYLKENNSDDDYIKIIENRVEGIEEEDEVSILEITKRLCKLSASLVKKGKITANNSIESCLYEEEIIEGPAMWFGWSDNFVGFEDIETIALGISIETGDAYIFAAHSVYEILSNEDIRFGNKKPEIVSNDKENKELWLKLFNIISDYEDEDFDEEGRFVTMFINYLNKVKQSVFK